MARIRSLRSRAPWSLPERLLGSADSFNRDDAEETTVIEQAAVIRPVADDWEPECITHYRRIVFAPSKLEVSVSYLF